MESKQSHDLEVSCPFCDIFQGVLENQGKLDEVEATSVS